MKWYLELSVLSKVFFWISVVASVLLVIQIILLVVSFAGGGDGDFEDFDGDMDTDSGLSLFTVKGMTAFFALGGWCGFAAATGLPGNNWAPVLIAIATGTAALFGVALAMRGVSKLQCSGNLVGEKLVGQTATVYVSVPSSRTGRGKITLTAQGRYMEADAVTDDPNRIATDEQVVILSWQDDFAVVERKNPAKTQEVQAEEINLKKE